MFKPRIGSMKLSQSNLFPSVFEGQDRRLDRLGDPLSALDQVVDWDAFRSVLRAVHHRKNRKNRSGRKPIDELMMFKILVLQSFYNLSDEQMEYQIEDRRSFRRFLGLSHENTRAPDRNTIWQFREKLGEKGLESKLFEEFNRQLNAAGFIARKGQMVDASIVRAPTQRNGRDENRQIRQGETPQDWSEPKRRQKDVEARWAMKHGKSHFGYKNHISVDHACNLIRSYSVTSANVLDAREFKGLLDAGNTSRDVWADSAYRTVEGEAWLKANGYRSLVHYKGHKHRPMTEQQLRANKKRSRVRVRVEHVFGYQQSAMGGKLVRTIGLQRARVKIGLMNLIYNMRRLVYLQTAPAF